MCVAENAPLTKPAACLAACFLAVCLMATPALAQEGEEATEAAAQKVLALLS